MVEAIEVEMVEAIAPPVTLVPVFAVRPEPGKIDVLVAIPAMNEERFIGSVVHAVLLEGYECLVIDDGSTDRTAAIAEAAGATVERHEHNLGKAAALNTAFQFARQRGVSILVAMDGDAQHDPREIRELLGPIEAGEADIVSGSRFIGDGNGGIPRVRRLGMQAFTVTSNLVSGVLATDSLSGFRAFSRTAIEAMRFKSHRFSVELEMPFLARHGGLRTAEVPITVSYADPPKRNTFGYGLKLVDGMIRLVGRYRPLVFFGVPGLVLLLGGIGLGALVVDTYQTTRQLAGGLALLSVLLVILGSGSVGTAVILHAFRGMFLELTEEIRALPESTASHIHHR